MTARQRLAERFRCWADRLDHHGAPKSMSMLTFTFEPGIGMVIHTAGPGRTELREHEWHSLPGCTLWYYGDDDYAKAHTEAVQT